MSHEIRNVAIAGATGNTGPAIVQTLLTYGFDVTALTRQASNAEGAFANEVKMIKVDYFSHQSLVSALKGIDAVVVCGVAMLPEQTNLIDAAIDAKVARFFPASFAGNMRDPKQRDLIINREKAETAQYLEARRDRISATISCTGTLFDWVLARGVLINMKQYLQRRFDNGDKRFSTTTVATAAKAIAAALKLGDVTENRTIMVQDLLTTQNQLLKWATELERGAKWKIEVVDTEELAMQSLKILQDDPSNMMRILMQRGVAVFGKEYESDFGMSDNAELGISMMSEAQVKDILRKLM